MELTAKFAKGLDQALCSRGKNKGRLKAKCPPVNTYGAAVWQAIMMYSNPYKVGLGHMMFMDKEKKELYDHVIEIGKSVNLRDFDKEGIILRELNLM